MAMGGEGGRGAERTDGFKQVLPSDVHTKNRFGFIRIFAANARFQI